MSGIGEGHAVQPGIKLRKHQGDEAAVDLSVADFAVDAGRTSSGADPGADEMANLRTDPGHHQSGRHPFARDIADHDRPACLSILVGPARIDRGM